MSWQNPTVILYALLTLYSRHHKIADLRYHADHHTAKTKHQVIGRYIKAIPYNKAIEHGSNGTEHKAADRSLNCLFGADRFNQLVLTKGSATEISKAVGYPREDIRNKEQILSNTLHIAQNDHSGIGTDDVKACHEQNTDLAAFHLAELKHDRSKEIDRHNKRSDHSNTYIFPQIAVHNACQHRKDECRYVKGHADHIIFI